MHKPLSVNKKGTCRHLRLVSNNLNTPAWEQPTPGPAKEIQSADVSYLTQAMMNRLWIPQTSTIVGLLDVGTSKDNFEELSKWVEVQLKLPTDDCAANEMRQLERRFCDAVSRFPEM